MTPGIRIGRSLVHLGYLGTIAYHAITRFVKAQAVAMASALDRATFERLVTPSVEGGQHVAGLRFGTPQVMRLLAALGCAGLTFKAFSHAELRALLIERLGAEAADVTSARVSYQLTKLRGKGLLRKVVGRNRYTLTDRGYRVAVYCTKLHERLFTPTLDSLDRVVRPTLVASPHRFDRALVDLNTHFDHLTNGPKAHDGTITTDAPDQMWGMDATSCLTRREGTATVFVVVDPTPPRLDADTRNVRI